MAGPATDFIRNVAAKYEGDDCLAWPYFRSRILYGMYNRMFASRFVCMMVHGDPPTPEHEAAHNCGKGHEGCVNPKHLRWATHAENMADMKLHSAVNGHGGVRGEAVKGSRLKEDDIRKIRALKGQVGPTAIGKMFGVNPVHVWKIQTGKKWAHVA